jgi:hypothetical protein
MRRWSRAGEGAFEIINSPTKAFDDLQKIRTLRSAFTNSL